METFLSSGFAAAPAHQPTPAQPIPIPSITKIDQGNIGQFLVTIQPVKARSYELRFAAVAAPGATINWTTIVVPKTKPTTPINNLTPGTTYTFQVRAFGNQIRELCKCESKLAISQSLLYSGRNIAVWICAVRLALVKP